MILEELVTLAPYNPPAVFTVRSRRTRIYVQSYRHLRLYCNTEQREREREKDREGGRVCTHACDGGEIGAREPGENESHDLNNSAWMFLMRGLADSRVREEDR